MSRGGGTIVAGSTLYNQLGYGHDDDRHTDGNRAWP